MFNFYNVEKDMLENDFEFHDFWALGTLCNGCQEDNNDRYVWSGCKVCEKGI